MTRPDLVRAPARPATLLVRGAHVVDPVARIDALHDVLIRDGEIAEIGAGGSLDAGPGAEVDERDSRGSVPVVVVAPGKHLDRALDMAEGLAKFPQETMLADRRSALEGFGLSLEEGLAREAEIGGAVSGVGVKGAARFAAGEGRGGAGAGV